VQAQEQLQRARYVVNLTRLTTRLDCSRLTLTLILPLASFDNVCSCFVSLFQNSTKNHASYLPQDPLRRIPCSSDKPEKLVETSQRLPERRGPAQYATALEADANAQSSDTVNSRCSSMFPRFGRKPALRARTSHQRNRDTMKPRQFPVELSNTVFSSKLDSH